MATRLAFFVKNGNVYSKEIEFKWMAGLSVTQKKRSIANMHRAIQSSSLEVSTKSEEELGIKLSAFNLRLNGIPVENVFQASKVFENGGPYLDLLNVSPKDAKRDERLHNSGRLIAFKYNGDTWELFPKTAFYDFIYLSAVAEQFTLEELNKILEYEFFTDIEFNHRKSINTQARTVALLKSILLEHDTLRIMTPDEFLEYHKRHVIS